jgi:hypothetical protein
MRLGLVITDDRCGRRAMDLLAAAFTKGWSIRCFLTDRGVLMLGDPRLTNHLDNDRMAVSLCELSVERYPQVAAALHQFADKVVIGGQYQNAELVRHSDRVIVL